MDHRVWEQLPLPESINKYQCKTIAFVCIIFEPFFAGKKGGSWRIIGLFSRWSLIYVGQFTWTHGKVYLYDYHFIPVLQTLQCDFMVTLNCYSIQFKLLYFSSHEQDNILTWTVGLQPLVFPTRTVLNSVTNPACRNVIVLVIAEEIFYKRVC